MDYKTLKTMSSDEQHVYLEKLSEKELNELFEAIVQELSDNPRISTKVYWSDTDYFAFCNGNMLRIPQGSADLPKGGPYPTIVAGTSAKEKEAIRKIVGKYGEDELGKLFDRLDDAFLCTYSDYPDYTDEEVLSVFEDKEDSDEETTDNTEQELVKELIADIRNSNGLFESLADLCDKIRRSDLDEDRLYYRYDGEYFDLMDNIFDVGDDPRDYEEIIELLGYLLDLENRIVEAER